MKAKAKMLTLDKRIRVEDGAARASVNVSKGYILVEALQVLVKVINDKEYPSPIKQWNVISSHHSMREAEKALSKI